MDGKMIDRRSLKCGLAALLMMSATALPAQAQSSDQLAAESLFRDARRLLDEGKYKEACEKLAVSQSLDAAAGTALNLARCYEKTGQVASAWARYREAASIAQATGQADRAATARKGADALEASLPRLNIRAPEDASERPQKITRDGEVVAKEAWGVLIPVDPGSHEVEASAPGKKPWATTVAVALRESKDVVVPPLADDPAASALAGVTPPPPQNPPSPTPREPDAAPSNYWSLQRTAGVAVGVVGVVGITIGIVEGLKYQSKKDDAASACDGTCSDPDKVAEAAELQNEATKAGNIGIVSGAIGGAALIGGIVLFATAGSGGGHARRVEIAPVAGFGDLGIRVRGMF
jgi:serine/threonine-protein kinase